MHDWRAVLAEIVISQERLNLTIDGLDDAALRAPSPLEGWTRGHVAHHIARNADSCSRLLAWAATGVPVPQYPGRAARDAEIEAGAGLPHKALAADVRESAARFAALAEALPEDRWDARVEALGDWGHPAWYLLYRRWREVEVHHVDLGASYTFADWPESYLRWELTESLPGLRDAVPYSRIAATDPDVVVEFGGSGPELRAPAVELLGWLSGRSDTSYAEVPPWPYPAATDWSEA
ncbi:maleylpyruvate isomerase family mycothiol-dependent enzyme [Actinocorallia sp. A-T 12471]|uniref:maleylpyruvate isomerase family mycothiol-dependent enzyme n=1 Tax=Actinocorallia sp. A-T 12471 TaxID=3089813 RepID=UPI0029CCABDE|nr:maleylpyruvate isomerase family mycothiol-dependent enzyme [Actinocorallia sp. A-T 12471]MDX6744931.1 maleylpyruvate isomerase family mycothiol-dependent enzyme [Actinocorallia sp. A-T 12471]